MCTYLGTFYLFDICFSVPEYLVNSKQSVHTMNYLVVNVKLSFVKNALERKAIFVAILVLICNCNFRYSLLIKF